MSELKTPATGQTTYNSCPAIAKAVGGVDSLEPGSSHVIATGACPAGARIGYEVSATGSLNLDYFQDYNPSPIGLYVTVC